jgi:hypothetical protein
MDETFSAVLAPMPMRSAGERVAERFVTAIALGEFVSGQRLPTERELAAMLDLRGRRSAARLRRDDPPDAHTGLAGPY